MYRNSLLTKTMQKQQLRISVQSIRLYISWLLFLRVMQENKSGCLFLNTV